LPWIDLPEQTAEDFAGADFDEVRSARGDQRLHAIHPTNSAGHLADECVLGGCGGGDQAAGHVGGNGDAGIGQRQRREDAGDLLLRWLHQGAVEGRADGEHDGAARSLELG
jgi:hypothetical protein